MNAHYHRHRLPRRRIVFLRLPSPDALGRIVIPLLFIAVLYTFFWCADDSDRRPSSDDAYSKLMQDLRADGLPTDDSALPPFPGALPGRDPRVPH